VSRPEGYEDLRTAFQGLAAAAPAEGADPERIWDAVTGALPPDERREVVDRVARDPSWALAWRLAHELWAASPERASRRAWAARAGGWATLAAGLFLMLGLGLWLRPAPEPGYREGATARVRSLVTEGLVLPRGRCVLRWAGPAGATYDLRVTSEDLVHVHTVSKLATGQYQVPEAFLAPVPSGARLLWQVDARLPDGTVLAGETSAIQVE
jgi:hypothetical protein